MKIVRSFIWVLLVFLVSDFSVQAQLNFTFSFQGDPTNEPIHMSLTGTVTGEIIGLTDNATSDPTDIIITSAPAEVGLPELSYDLAANGWTLTAEPGFTVTNGVITSADFLATNSGNSYAFFGLNYTGTGYNLLEDKSAVYIDNVGGFSGATYSPLVSETAPEPTVASLVVGSLLLILAFRRRFSPAA